MAKKKAAAKKQRETVLVQSKVKEYVRQHDVMVSSELIEALNDAVCDMLDRAVERATANNRKTVRPADI